MTPAADAARLRGIATHRVLELLNFADCDSPTTLNAQRAKLLGQRALSSEEANRADWPGIHWFLWKSQAGQRLLAAAKQIAASKTNRGESSLQIRREIPFTWLAPPTLTTQPPLVVQPLGWRDDSLSDPADCPTIRGVIDLLLVDPTTRTAEILDYKTDSESLWQSRLPDYQRQMSYYLRAASDILGFPVTQATLIFLSPEREIPVTPQT